MPNPEQMRQAVQAYVDSFARQDKTAFLATLADEVAQTGQVDTPPLSGKPALAGYWDGVFNVANSVEFTVRDLFVAGDEVALVFHIIQRRKQGPDLILDGIIVFQIDDAGKIVAIRGYSNPEHMKPLATGRVPEHFPVKGKIAVLVEEHFDETEYVCFDDFFPAHGYQVDYVSRLWGNPQLTFTANDHEAIVIVTIDIDHIEPTDYQGIILVGGYAMDRLRYEEHPKLGQPNQAPAVQFLRKAVAAMDQGKLKIGAICHGLWLFCASPDLIKGRQVTCAHNIIADVQNAGGIVVFDGDETAVSHIDGGLITGRHRDFLQTFMPLFLSNLGKPALLGAQP